MKKLLAILLLLCLTVPVLASANPVSDAVKLFHADEAFRRYASFTEDENGNWTAHDQLTQQLLREISGGGMARYLEDGIVFLCPYVRGDQKNGLAEPVLRILLVKREFAGIDSLSLAVGGTRWDFVVPAARIKLGTANAEQIDLPLNAEGLEMLRTMANNGFDVALFGTRKNYTAAVYPDQTAAKAVQEARSLPVLQSFLTLLAKAGLAVCAVPDLNEARWPDRPEAASVVELTEQDAALPPVDDVFGLAQTRNTADIMALEQLLIDSGFLTGPADGKYTAAVRTGIREAQQYYELLPTGQADQLLMGLLSGSASVPAAEADMEAGEAEDWLTAPEGMLSQAYCLDNACTLQLNRIRIANQAMPPERLPEADPLAAGAVLPENSDHALLILDGTLQNLAGESLYLPLNLQAELLVDGLYTYPCTLRCEQNRGMVLGVQVLPLESVSLLVTAEIPENVLQDHHLTLLMTVCDLPSVGDESPLSFVLE